MLKKLRKIDNNQPLQVNQDVKGLAEGMMVEHARFGKGVIENIEGKGQDRKALISFKDFGSNPLITLILFELSKLLETFSKSNGEGFGNFEYAVPSGYFALCTKNLAEYG